MLLSPLFFFWDSSYKHVNSFIHVSGATSALFCIFILLFSLCFLFIYLWLCWVFVSVRGLSLVAASGGHSSSWCMGLSLSRPLLLQSTGSRRAGSVIVAHGPSCSACGIFPDQGSNPCPLHWQADSQPLRHQGSPLCAFYVDIFSLHLFYFRKSLFALSNLLLNLSIAFLISIIIFLSNSFT